MKKSNNNKCAPVIRVIQIDRTFEAFTMDGIAKCAFGLQVDSQNNPDDPFVKNAKTFTANQLLDPILLLSGI